MERRGDGVAVVTLDVPGSAVNVLSRELVAEFRSVLDRIDRDPAIRAVVLTSGKPDGFIAGANLKQVAAMKTASEAEAFVEAGQELFDRIAASAKPFVAAIHGAALGGGLELALACAGRVASDDPKTVLALPEVMVGLLPAAGGTQRLPRLIGLDAALSMLLTGDRIRSRKALRIGLVDELARREALVDDAAALALRIASGAWRRRAPRLRVRALTFTPLRALVLRKARQAVSRKTRGHYPAPSLLLDCVEAGLAEGATAGRRKEVESFGRLVVSPQARNLMWLFLATTEAKKLEAAEPRRVQVLGVIGAGLMGEGIASVSMPISEVRLRDVSEAALENAVRRIEESLAKRVASGSLADAAAKEHRARLRPSIDLASLGGCDLVIEAVFEELSLKQRVLAETEALLDDDAVYASNTSALPIAAIAEGARRPERVLGMHYFSPVPKMPLLEIVATTTTSPRAIATAHAFGTSQGKTVIIVRDGPGFYTTRILAPYINEAMTLLEEGATIEAVDGAMRDFGFPLGPLALLDEVGLEVGAHVAADLGRVFEARGLRGSDALPRLVAAGFAGRKNGRGFYQHGKGRKAANAAVYEFFGGRNRREPDALTERLSLVMANEAVWCLQEQVVASSRDADLGAVLGLGFPPFRGGPLHFIDAAGAASVVTTMNRLRDLHGARFEPAPMLKEAAAQGRRFFD